VRIFFDGVLSRLDGLLLTTGSIAYTTFAYLSGKRDRSRIVEDEFDAGIRELGRPAWLDATLVGR